MGAKSTSSERGQIIVIIAAGIFFVMLGATALAVDWGNSLLAKRRLQNTADAAALAAAYELNRGGDAGSAVSVAQSVVSANTGGTVSLPYPGTGSGTGLSEGIEIGSAGDVRVALVRQVGTYFAPIFGVNSLTVRVRSRASMGPYGVLPIAVKRFSEGDTAFDLGSGSNPESVHDYLAPSSSDLISDWPSPLTSPAPTDPGYSPPDAYDPSVSGRVMPLIGQNALANVAHGNDFHFWVAPDVRGITHPSLDLHNGVTPSTSIQQLKNTQSSYFLAKGYPGPNPQVGEQLAALNGTNTSHTVDAMRTVYRRGDIVTAMVYDGTVYRKPEFYLTMDSEIKDSPNIGPGGSALTFNVTLVPLNDFTSTGVQFSATGLEGWADWAFESGSPNSTYTTSVGGGGLTLSFSVSSTSVVQGARTATIQAYDPYLNHIRTASATVVVGAAEAFSQACPEAHKVVEQGSATSFDLNLRGWNGYDDDVSFGSLQWYTGGSSLTETDPPTGITVTLPATTRVRTGHTSKEEVTVTTTPTAQTGTWMFRVSAIDPDDPILTQNIYLGLQVVAAAGGNDVSNTTAFVYVLGYANFVITYADNASSPSPSLDNNTIYAYAVSPLVSDLSLLGRGMSGRLIGWNQTR